MVIFAGRQREREREPLQEDFSQVARAKESDVLEFVYKNVRWFPFSRALFQNDFVVYEPRATARDKCTARPHSVLSPVLLLRL